MRRHLTWLTASALAIVAVALVALVAWWQMRPGSPLPATPAQLAAGKALYAEQCASCHGAKLEGQPDWRIRLPSGRLPAPPHDASGHTWHHPDGDLFALTKYGLGPFAPSGYQSDMPAFDDKLTDQQIRDVLAYIKGTWPAEIQARQAAVTQQTGKQ